VTGQDVVYKDIIEPLESVSVSITATDKTDVSEFGDPLEARLILVATCRTQTGLTIHGKAPRRVQ
jgi:PsbP